MKANTLGNFLYQRREEIGMTKKELASIIGVSLRTISNWENDYSDRNPNIVNIISLSMVLKFSVDDMPL